MRVALWEILGVTLCPLILVALPSNGIEVMTNNWYVQLHGNPGVETAKQVAKRNGFSYVGPVSISTLSVDLFHHFQTVTVYLLPSWHPYCCVYICDHMSGVTHSPTGL